MKGILNRLIFVFLDVVMFPGCSSNEDSSLILLSGEWQFKIDSLDVGAGEAWYSKNFNDSIRLPGSMKEHGKGFEPTLQTRWTGSIYDSSFYYDERYAKYRQQDDIKFPFWLTPPRHYEGPAWYSREIRIPERWSNKKVVLNLERPHWETTIWIDSVQAGSSQRSLSTPHNYDLTNLLNPGTHKLTIQVDNRIDEVNMGPDSHSLSDHTQGNWNGIAGDMELEASPAVHIADLELYPNVKNQSVKAVVDIRNMTGETAAGEICLSARSFNTGHTHEGPVLTEPFQVEGDSLKMEIIYKLGEDAQLWDEFNPQHSVEMSVIRDIFWKQSERVNFYTNENTDDLKPEKQN